jgi:hypothetical protein
MHANWSNVVSMDSIFNSSFSCPKWLQKYDLEGLSIRLEGNLSLTKSLNMFGKVIPVLLICICRRQKELEAKLVEEETAKRIEEMVALRVAEELERRKDEIEAEVLRRVEEAKAAMEKEMMEELQKQKAAQLEEEKRREVDTCPCPKSLMLTLDQYSLLLSEEEMELEVFNDGESNQESSYLGDDLELFLLSTFTDSEAVDYFALLHYIQKHLF